MTALIFSANFSVPAIVAAAGDRAGMRFLEFFTANIRNPHTRRAYARAAEEFLTSSASAGLPSIAAVQPVHVATWIEAGTRELAAPSVKQRLAAIRHLFDWLVAGQAGAGIATKLGNHSFRATGITAYLKNGGTLEKAAANGEPCFNPHSTIAG